MLGTVDYVNENIVNIIFMGCRKKPFRLNGLWPIYEEPHPIFGHKIFFKPCKFDLELNLG